MLNHARQYHLGYREQEHIDAPSWGLQKFPVALQRAIKAEAAISGRTITEVLVDELTAIADRISANPGTQAPALSDPGELVHFWTIKHFPEDLRTRLKALAGQEHTPLYVFVVRELWAALGV
ncbi:MAG: hypothetical protein KQJ78_07575 [Deltaproteobacteria bacterium]|nr:hypothetical protein [Deltaproteobacteria bacterium]